MMPKQKKYARCVGLNIPSLGNIAHGDAITRSIGY